MGQCLQRELLPKKVIQLWADTQEVTKYIYSQMATETLQVVQTATVKLYSNNHLCYWNLTDDDLLSITVNP